MKALRALYDASRGLAGERRDLCRVVRVEGEPSPPPLDAIVDPRVRQLRQRTAWLLRELGARADKPLLSAVTHPERWDQVDALHIVSPVLTFERLELQAQWRALATEPGASEAALEALATLATAFDLARLMERRFATFVRSRLRHDEPLLIDGRPFLDVAAALIETAEAFS